MSQEINEVNTILSWATNSYEIDWAIEEFRYIQTRLRATGKLWIDWPFDDIYNLTSGVVPWKVYTIWAYSNIGKSKFAYYHIQYFLKNNLKVLFINLEVWKWMAFGNIACSYEAISYYDMIQGHDFVREHYKNLIITDDLFSLDVIEEKIKSDKYDIVFIDFVQNIQAPGWDYERNASIAKAIQRIAIETNCTIFSLSQLSNATAQAVNNWNIDFISLKGSWEYYASSDVVFLLYKIDPESNIIDLKVVKNKFGWAGAEFELEVDYAKSLFVQKPRNEVPF